MKYAIVTTPDYGVQVHKQWGTERGIPAYKFDKDFPVDHSQEFGAYARAAEYAAQMNTAHERRPYEPVR